MCQLRDILRVLTHPSAFLVLVFRGCPAHCSDLIITVHLLTCS